MLDLDSFLSWLDVRMKNSSVEINHNIEGSTHTKPIQKPHIPIYLGGYSQSTFVRVANYANGWICVMRHPADVPTDVGSIITVVIWLEV